MRAKPKPTRNTFTPRLLVKQLAEDVLGFKRETPQVQAALASMVWMGATKMRQHTVHEGFMSFHHKELAQLGGTDPDQRSQRRLNLRCLGLEPVSYTHLTLPTSDLV